MGDFEDGFEEYDKSAAPLSRLRDGPPSAALTACEFGESYVAQVRPAWNGRRAGPSSGAGGAATFQPAVGTLCGHSVCSLGVPSCALMMTLHDIVGERIYLL